MQPQQLVLAFRTLTDLLRLGEFPGVEPDIVASAIEFFDVLADEMEKDLNHDRADPEIHHSPQS